jgi:predicted nucleic acid-binding protein
MALVISDASTLIHLANIGRLGLLKQFFGHVVVPPGVWKEVEVVDLGQGRLGALEVQKAGSSGWMSVEAPADAAFVRALSRDLDDGEAEVIALAVERKADLILVDETEARRVADLYGLAKTGVIGLLLRAKREKVIELLKPELDRLVDQSGFWIDVGLYQQTLEAVGEKSE